MKEKVLRVLSELLVEHCDVDSEAIDRSKHIFDDLGVDSLDFLDMTFEVDKALGVKLPLEDWMREIEENGELATNYFVVGNLCTFIESALEGAAE